MDIPSQDNRFDAVTISFGIRNMTNVDKALREMRRVLKPGGRVLVLEFSLPVIVSSAKCTSSISGMSSLPLGNGYLEILMRYRYLNKTIETFPHGAAFCRLLKEAGFVNTRAHPITFGIASIYRGDKPVEAKI